MTQPSDAPNPSPQLIFQTISGHQRTAALKAAVELELFSAIGEGNHTPATLATRCQAAERGVRMLADFLTMLGFLTKQDGQYHLTEDSAVFLDRQSPAYLGGTLEFMLSPPLVDGFRHLTQAVRNGGTAIDEKGTTAEDHPEWVTFARAMVPMMIGPARWIAEFLSQQSGEVQKVLDIAAGHGIFGVEIAKRFPRAEIVAVDWENVLAVAQEHASAAGVSSRYQTLPGSAFEVDFGEGYDVALLTNFLHHFDPASCETLLKKVYAALNQGGRVVTLEFIPNEGRISPESADFAIVMLATTPSGDAYTFAELSRMFRNAGFTKNELHEVPNSKEHVVVSYKT